MILMPNGQTGVATEQVTEGEMEWMLLGEELLKRLNLWIACPQCLRSGNISGAMLRGSNDRGDHVFTVRCDCTVKMLRVKR